MTDTGATLRIAAVGRSMSQAAIPSTLTAAVEFLTDEGRFGNAWRIPEDVATRRIHHANSATTGSVVAGPCGSNQEATA